MRLGDTWMRVLLRTAGSLSKSNAGTESSTERMWSSDSFADAQTSCPCSAPLMSCEERA